MIVTASGCAVVERAADFVNQNPFFVDTLTRQSVARYAERGETELEKSKRASEVEYVARELLVYIDGNPTATIDQIIDVLEAQVAWERLSRPDRLLVKDIIRGLEISLEQRQREQLKIGVDEDVVIAVRSLLQTVISAAVYLK